MDTLAQLFTQYVSSYGYLASFTILLLENSIFLGLLVPGDTIAILGGYYAGQGALSLPVAILVMTVGSALGDNLGFLLGRKMGKEWLLKTGPKFGYKLSKIREADRFWEKHGEKAILIGDFVSYVRTFVPFFAGTSPISHRRFALWDLLAVFAHAALLATLGYFFGDQWEKIRDIFGLFGLILFLVFLVIIFKFLKRKRNSR